MFAAGAALLIAAAPPPMSVATFLAKADALMKRGPFALLSSDYRLLKSEGEAAGDALKAEHQSLIKAHKPTPYCPPEKGFLGADELLSGFRAIPPADRARMTVKDGMRTYLSRKWPCKA